MQLINQAALTRFVMFMDKINTLGEEFIDAKCSELRRSDCLDADLSEVTGRGAKQHSRYLQLPKVNMEDKAMGNEDKIKETEEKIRNLISGRRVVDGAWRWIEIQQQYLLLGRLHEQEGNPDLAIDAYGTGIAFSPMDKPSDDIILNSNTAELLVRRGYLKTIKGDYISAIQDNREAFDINGVSTISVFRDIQEENPRDPAANTLLALYSFAAGSCPDDELLGAMRTAPEATGQLLNKMVSCFGHFDKRISTLAQVLLSVLSYETNGKFHGEQGSYTQFRREGREGVLGFPSEWVSLDSNIDRQLVESRSEAFFKLWSRNTHPVGAVGFGYCLAQLGDLLSAIETFRELDQMRPELDPMGTMHIERVLELAPKTIEELLERRELQQAALLSEHLGDFKRAAELYGLMADGLEKGTPGIAESCKLTISTGHRFETHLYEPSSENAATFFEKAAECWEKAADQTKSAKCRSNAHRLRKQPKLEVFIADHQKLILGEWDGLNIRFENHGFGPARNVRIGLEGPFTRHGAEAMMEVGVEKGDSMEIVIRPDEAGRRVPLTIHISYQDDVGTHELPAVTKYMEVAQP